MVFFFFKYPTREIRLLVSKRSWSYPSISYELRERVIFL